MNCEQVANRLDAYSDKMLSGESESEVADHLENCAACAKAIEDRARVKNLLQRAVRNEIAPAALQVKIQDQIRANQRGSTFLFTQRRVALLAAAFLVALCLSVWSAVSLRHHGQAPGEFYEASLDRALSVQGRELFDIGLGDHVHCALQSGFADRHDSFAEMSKNLGANYIELVPLVKEKAAAGYELVVAHRCLYGGREFVHLIMRKDAAILSLVITEKNGESFSGNGSISGNGSVAEASPHSDTSGGVPLYQKRLRDFEVAGFETKSHVAFIVSNLRAADNLQFASNVAPSVRALLSRLEA